MTQCLRLPAFRRLLSAYVLNELAWSVGTLALSVLVFKETGSALGSTAFFLCSQFLPALLSPALVARVDGLVQRHVLPVLYGVEALLFGVLAWFTHHFTLGPVLVLALVDGVLAATARSLAAAARGNILKPLDLLHEGNAITNVGFSAALMGGPIIGGLVVAAGGTVAALLINCGLFAVIGLVLTITPLPDSGGRSGSGRRRLLDGLGHVRSDPILFRLLVVQTIGLVFFTVTIPVEVVYAQHTLDAGPGGYGALMSAWGLGAVAGSGVYARWRRTRTEVLFAGGGLALGVGFATLALAPALAVAVVGSALAGIGNGVESIAARTAVQERTPESWMALVMSVVDSLSQLAPGLGILVGGLVTELASSRAAFGVGAAGSLAFAFLAPLALQPARSVRRRRAGAAGARAGTKAPGQPAPPDAVPPGSGEASASGDRSLA